MAAFDPSQLRGAPRIATRAAAILDVAGARHEVALEEVSSTGASISGAPTLAAGTAATLEILGKRPVRTPVLVRRSGKITGLRFGRMEPKEVDRFRAFLAPLLPALGPEAVHSATGPAALSSALLQSAPFYESVGLDSLCSQEELRARMEDLTASVAKAVKSSEAKSIRRVRLVQIQRLLLRLTPVWEDPSERVAYDFRFGIVRVRERADLASSGAGLPIEELRAIWRRVHPTEAQSAASLLQEASASPEVAGALRKKAQTLDPFHEEFVGSAEVSGPNRASTKSKSRGVRGSVSDMDVMEIVQAVASGRRDAEVHLRREGETVGLLAFAGGEVVGAFTANLRAGDAFNALVHLGDGEFTIRYEPPRAEARHMRGTAQGLLLEAMRVQDEAERDGRSLTAQLGPIPPELLIEEPKEASVAEALADELRVVEAQREVERMKRVVEESQSQVLRAREEVEAASALELRRTRRRGRLVMSASATLGILVGGVALLTLFASELDERAYRDQFLDANQQILAGNLEAGTAGLMALVKEHPKRPELHRQLGDAYARAGRRAESVAAYRRYVELAADDEDKVRVSSLLQAASSAAP